MVHRFAFPQPYCVAEVNLSRAFDGSGAVECPLSFPSPFFRGSTSTISPLIQEETNRKNTGRPFPPGAQGLVRKKEEDTAGILGVITDHLWGH